MSVFKIFPLWSLLCASPFLLTSASPAPEPAPAVITAAPIIPRSPSEVHNEREYREMLHYEARALAERQLKPGISVCFGTGAICTLSLSMKCDSSLVGDEWYECQCTTGRVATNAACQACQDFYGLGGGFSLSNWVGYCSEKGFELAPVPATIISSWSQFNATMTYKTARTSGAASGTTAGGSGGIITSSSLRAAATGSGSILSLPTVSLSRGSTTRLTGTLTLLGDPTGVKPTPLTTTVGLAPLQNIPAGNVANGLLAGELPRLLCAGMAGLSVLIGVVFVL